MASGLQVWDASGNITLDTNNRLTKVLGSVSIAAGSNGSVTLKNIPYGNQRWAFFNVSTGGALYGAPAISISGNTISWTYASGNLNIGGTLLYGVF